MAGCSIRDPAQELPASFARVRSEELSRDRVFNDMAAATFRAKRVSWVTTNIG
jgi:hypothetical protein